MIIQAHPYPIIKPILFPPLQLRYQLQIHKRQIIHLLLQQPPSLHTLLIIPFQNIQLLLIILPKNT